MIAWVAWTSNGDPRQPQGRPVILFREHVRATIDYLRRCQMARATGYRVSYTTDPEWLVDMAINRRAGWPDDPDCHGSAIPTRAGAYPRRASETDHVRQFAGMLNGSRWYPRKIETRWLPRWVRERVAHRIRTADDY